MKVEMPKALNHLNLTRSKNVATEIFFNPFLLTASQKMSFSSSEKHKKYILKHDYCACVLFLLNGRFVGDVANNFISHANSSFLHSH
jgi:hypothetical protein